MESLLEKLKPEMLSYIDNEAARYPNTFNYASQLKENLSKVLSVADMRYEDALMVMNLHEKVFGVKTFYPWDCFVYNFNLQK